MSEKDQKIFDMQPKSTQDALLQSEIERKFHRYSEIPKEAECVKEDGSVDLNIRHITEEEHELYDGREGLRRKAGERFEAARTNYLRIKASQSKIHSSLLSKIETDHVMPSAEVRDRAEKAYLGVLKSITEKFKQMWEHLFKPSHAEIVAKEMKRLSDEK